MGMKCKARQDGALKRRLISDCLRSGATSRTQLPEWFVLPKWQAR